MPELLTRIPAPVVRKTGHSLRRPSKLDMCTERMDDSPMMGMAVSGGLKR